MKKKIETKDIIEFHSDYAEHKERLERQRELNKKRTQEFEDGFKKMREDLKVLNLQMIEKKRFVHEIREENEIMIQKCTVVLQGYKEMARDRVQMFSYLNEMRTIDQNMKNTFEEMDERNRLFAQEQERRQQALDPEEENAIVVRDEPQKKRPSLEEMVNKTSKGGFLLTYLFKGPFLIYKNPMLTLLVCSSILSHDIYMQKAQVVPMVLFALLCPIPISLALTDFVKMKFRDLCEYFNRNTNENPREI